MKQKTIYPIWGIMYVICGALGFLTQRNAVLNVVFTIISVLFFVPGVILLIYAYKEHDKKALKRLRLISLSILGLTLVLLVLNFASAKGSIALGNTLNFILGAVSVPMFCCKIWALPLFLWACMFMASFPKVVGK